MSKADLNKRPEEVSGMFDSVARGYDRTNAVLSVGNSALWRIATVRAVDPKPGERILDVAAGTGTSAAAFARSGAQVVALDFSRGMVEEGRRRHPELEFIEGNAEALPFGDDEFDAVTISFGLRNVQRPKLALDEMFRVLKPGGRLVICEFSKPPVGIVRAGYQAYLKWVMPAVVNIASTDADAYSYLADSIEDWPDQGTLSQWIRGAGFTRVAHRNLTAGVVALHRGRKPEDAAIRASVSKRRRASRSVPSAPADAATDASTGGSANGATVEAAVKAATPKAAAKAATRAATPKAATVKAPPARAKTAKPAPANGAGETAATTTRPTPSTRRKPVLDPAPQRPAVESGAVEPEAKRGANEPASERSNDS
ncbi:class I SAM-dependent methyltransferase [Ruicaihuangia caeni]|uniref:Demethylmenaquinone methyltransferase n=1 Tax=Ruicaihuangia caeni TaxID=3042517 RepID=A0AAW6T5Y2_9MICO|nr:ubiquinone/menaquinone biosynthesis methyltransferase [Klugiella sp. YN-L-19]MDI2098894.1 ubiquinone/menaquinone biosynthesis methyltransferase [Klugiella sp. YN-L-19]